VAVQLKPCVGQEFTLFSTIMALVRSILVLSALLTAGAITTTNDEKVTVSVDAAGHLLSEKQPQPCDGYVTCDLKFKDDSFATDPAGLPMTMFNVCNVSGKALDLQVTNLTMYTPAKAANTKVTGKVGQLNLKVGTNVLVRFQLLEHDTKSPFEVDTVYFSIVDFDSHPDHGEEWEKMTVTGGFKRYVLHEPTSVVATQLANNTMIFKSSTPGQASNNPTDVMALTDEQKKLAVALAYSKVSHWDIAFEVGSSSKYGRNFVIGGASSILYPCDMPVPAPVPRINCPHYAARISKNCSCC